MSRLTDFYKDFQAGRDARDAEREAVGLPTSSDVVKGVASLLVRDPRERKPKKTVSVGPSATSSSGSTVAVAALAVVAGFLAFGGKKAGL